MNFLEMLMGPEPTAEQKALMARKMSGRARITIEQLRSVQASLRTIAVSGLDLPTLAEAREKVAVALECAETLLERVEAPV